MTTIAKLVEQKLWRPLLMEKEGGWTTDEKGLERMESGFHGTARDVARIGLLYLIGGRDGSSAILPGSWFNDMQTVGTEKPAKNLDGRTWAYGLGWRVNLRESGDHAQCAIGNLGQFIYVSQKHEAVIVRHRLKSKWSDYDWTELFYDASTSSDLTH
ncbi:MAG: hypothetical protein AAF483_26050 [Planctomycetota bacterium]